MNLTDFVNANFQIEYVLLNGANWREYSLSDLRQSRLRSIVTTAQSLGLLMGADAAIAITQQVMKCIKALIDVPRLYFEQI